MAQRADIALTERGLVQSRSRAKALITEGKITLNGKVLTKPSVPVHEDDRLEVIADLPFVGRGGLKLAGAVQTFGLHLQGRICMDIGASTGGFTDCMLQNGAAKVYAIDVGHGQLDAALCADARVVNLEGTDVRLLTPHDLPDSPDFAGIDVSFISLRLVLPAAAALLADPCECIALIKPQFEAGRSAIGKHGIVRSAKAHVQVLQEMTALAESLGFAVQNLCVSPIQGGSGNTEYLLYLSRMQGEESRIPDLRALVASAGLH